MSDQMQEILPVPANWPKAEALFRAQIVMPLVDPLSSPEEKRRWRSVVTSREHTLPDGRTRRISERTLRRWVAQFRETGFLGLERSRRVDRGVLKKLRPDLLERAVELKKENPRRSVPHILRILETEQEEVIDITANALWRHLSALGFGGRSAFPKSGLRRWEALGPNDLWQSDVKHGPFLPDPLKPGSYRKTFLIAFLDDYSRLITHAEWFWAEDVYCLEVAFQKALLRKGKPSRVYVDRGQIYQSHVFRSACAELGIRHISSTAYHPEGKGKIEKFWRNIDDDFLLELGDRPASTLEELNQLFEAWLNQVYHSRVHSETEETPVRRFVSQPTSLLPHPERLAQLFLWRDTRVVDKTGCISFENNRYQVEPGLEKRRVEIRYHPLHLERLQIWTGEKRWRDALPVDLHRKVSPDVNPRHRESKNANMYLDALVRKNEAKKRQITLSPLRFTDDEGGSEHV